jgi:hypothetical protein
MNDAVKSIGSALRRIYGTVVERPLSWGMIDKLSALDDKDDSVQASEPSGSPIDELSDLHTSQHVNETASRK